MTARDDYPHLAWLEESVFGDSSDQSKLALDEIDRLRDEIKKLNYILDRARGLQ